MKTIISIITHTSDRGNEPAGRLAGRAAIVVAPIEVVAGIVVCVVVVLLLGATSGCCETIVVLAGTVVDAAGPITTGPGPAGPVAGTPPEKPAPLGMMVVLVLHPDETA